MLTFAYYLAFIGLGLTAASLGPTLLGLAQQTGSHISQISFLFAARSFGYLIGSFSGGRMLDRLPCHRTLGAAIITVSILFLLVPSASVLWTLTAIMLSVGFMEGIVDVGANTLIVWVHREKVGPWMNGLHLFYAVGAFLAPVLAAQVVSVTGGYSGTYTFLAVLLVPIGLWIRTLLDPEPIIKREEHSDFRPNPYFLASLVFLFLLIAGTEISFGGWVFTYSVKTGLTGEETAAYVNAAFWGAFMLSRLASIPIAARFRPGSIILVDLMLSLLAFGIMLSFPSSTTALWAGSMLFGAGIASAFPTLITFAGRKITITGSITGWFFVGASAGNTVLPWIIGQCIEPFGPKAVLVIITGGLVLALMMFFGVLKDD